MIAWSVIPKERSVLYSPIGLRLVDEFTGKAPFGWIRAYLDFMGTAGSWQRTDIRPAITEGGILTYPALERRANVAGKPPGQYRVRLDTRFYRPKYRKASNGIEFNAYPYNDTNAPSTVPNSPIDEFLLPAPNYPFQTHVRVLHGFVEDEAGAKIPDAWVTDKIREWVLSDERGAFALPLRWPQNDAQLTIDVTDQRSGKTGSIDIRLPAALQRSNTITIRNT